MTIALAITGSLLAVASLVSASGKLKKMPPVMEAMASVGVKPAQIPLLAYLEISGALGLAAGIKVAPLGVAASLGLALYFAGALVMHAKKKHTVSEFGPALGIFVLTCVVFALELSR